MEAAAWLRESGGAGVDADVVDAEEMELAGPVHPMGFCVGIRK